MSQYLEQPDSELASNLDRITRSEIEAAVSDSLETLYGRVSNILTSRKPELIGEPEEFQHTTIAALQIALESLTRSLSLTITAKKFHKDRPPRVHQLPCDVFIPILWECLPVATLEYSWRRNDAKFVIRDYLAQLYLLRRVCGSWRDVIDSNPSFWAYISAECPGFVVDEALQKSGSARLFIADSYVNEERYVAFFNQVSGHVHRWETITFHHIPTTSIARTILCTPTPALCKAFIKVVSDTENAPAPIDLFSGQAAALQTLEIKALPVPWASLVFGGLRSFEISSRANNRGTLGITAINLLQIIAKMLRLEDLTISQPRLNLDNTATLASTDHDTQLTDLSHLQCLKIDDISGTLIPRFIGTFRIPVCRYLYLRCQKFHPLSPGFLQELLEAAQHIIHPALRDKQNSEATLYSQLHRGKFQWEGGGCGDFRFELYLAGLPCERWIWFMDQFCTSISSEMLLHFQSRFSSSDLSLFDRPARWQAVTSVRVEEHPDVGRFLQYLTQPLTQQGTVATWPFENLRRLTISGYGLNCGPELLQFIRARWQPTQRNYGFNMVRSRYQLKVMDRWPLSINKKQIRDIRDILRDGEVRIERR